MSGTYKGHLVNAPGPTPTGRNTHHMTTTAYVPVDEMRDRLLDVDTVRERLARTEPITHTTFAMNAPAEIGATFELEEGWASDPGLTEESPIRGFVTIGPERYRLTMSALLEFTSALNITKKYAKKCPPEMLTDHINHWCRHADPREVKALLVPDTHVDPVDGTETAEAESMVKAFTKGTIDPFSNLRFLDSIVQGVQARYGTDAEVLVDYKFHHDFERTRLRLIVPEHARAMRRGVDAPQGFTNGDDTWSAGIQFSNSLTGASTTSLKGYMFRWWCTNGCISTRSESGTWNRRQGGQGDEVYEWARHAVDEILGGLEDEFDAVEAMAATTVREDDLNEILADMFDRYRIPVAARESIISEMVNTDDLTMYGVLNAVTQSANDGTLPDHMAETVMTVGGDIPRSYADGTTAFVPLDPEARISDDARTGTLVLADGTEIDVKARRLRG